jgi:hypothetical protein
MTMSTPANRRRLNRKEPTMSKPTRRSVLRDSLGLVAAGAVARMRESDVVGIVGSGAAVGNKS